MPNPPPIDQYVVLHLDTTSLTAEIDTALQQLTSGLSGTKLPQMATPALTPGSFASGLPDLTNLFQSLSRFGQAIDDLSNKLRALNMGGGVAAGGTVGGGTPSPTMSPTWSAYQVAASGGPSSALTPEAVLKWAFSTPAMFHITQQLPTFGNTALNEQVRNEFSKFSSAAQRIEQIVAHGTQADMKDLQTNLSVVNSFEKLLLQVQNELQVAINKTMPEAPQLVGMVNAGQEIGKKGTALASTLTGATLGNQNVDYYLGNIGDLRTLATTANLPPAPSPYNRAVQMFSAGALGYAATQQIMSAVQAAMSPLEPLMGANVLNGVQVAMQGAPVYNAAAQGQTLPLNFWGLEHAYNQSSKQTGMPMFQSLETAVAAQTASGIAGGMFFFKNASDLFQFSQALGVSSSLMGQVAGQAQVGGVTNFRGYIASLLGMNQGTGLTNSALLSEVAQLQQALLTMGVSPAGAELGFGTFATAAHLGGVNGAQTAGLFNAFSQAQMGPGQNILQQYAQLAAEGTWLKTPGVAQTLGFPTNNSIGAGLAMGMFQSTPLSMSGPGAAKMLSMLNYLTPFAQGSATNPMDALMFFESSGLGVTPQSEALKGILSNPTSAHYLTGALHADLSGGSTALHHYIGDINNSHTRNLLNHFVSSFKSGPEYSIQQLTANVQNAKFSLGVSELGSESKLSGQSPIATGIGGFVLNTLTEAAPWVVGGILASVGGKLGGTLLSKALPGLFTRTVASGAAGDAVAGAGADVAGAGGLAALLGGTAVLPIALGTAAILATPGHGPRHVSGGPLSQLWNWLNTDPWASPSSGSGGVNLGGGGVNLGNNIIANLEIQNLKIDSMQTPGQNAVSMGAIGMSPQFVAALNQGNYTPPGQIYTPGHRSSYSPGAAAFAAKYGSLLTGPASKLGLTATETAALAGLGYGESGGNPKAFHQDTGSADYGLWQINIPGADLTGNALTSIDNPATNAQYAASIWASKLQTAHGHLRTAIALYNGWGPQISQAAQQAHSWSWSTIEPILATTAPLAVAYVNKQLPHVNAAIAQLTGASTASGASAAEAAKNNHKIVKELTKIRKHMATVAHATKRGNPLLHSYLTGKTG